MVLAQRAIQMDPDSPLGYQTLGNLYALNSQGERDPPRSNERRSVEEPNETRGFARMTQIIDVILVISKRYLIISYDPYKIKLVARKHTILSTSFSCDYQSKD